MRGETETLWNLVGEKPNLLLCSKAVLLHDGRMFIKIAGKGFFFISVHLIFIKSISRPRRGVLFVFHFI